MKRLNQFLAVLVSLLMVALVFEGGLRLVGRGPKPTMNRFDARYGWTKVPNADIRRVTDEFDVRLQTNSRGLREPESVGYERDEGIERILLLGDSFTLGYTVPSRDTISALLERRLLAEGRSVEVLNGGTEGWSTDQEVLWLAGEGARYQPDIVILQMYENDIFWNAQDRYLHYPKPRLAADGSGRADGAALEDPGEGGWWKRNSAIGSGLAGILAPPQLPTLPGTRLPAEWGVRIEDGASGYSHTATALEAFAAVAKQVGATPLVLVIPDKAQVDAAARDLVARVMQDERYDPDRPFNAMINSARAAGLAVVDPLAALRRASLGGAVYFARDWHTNAAGNVVLANVLADALADAARLGAAPRAAGAWSGPAAPEAAPRARWPWFAAGIWLILSTLYWRRFPEQGVAGSYVPVGLLVASVVAIVFGVDFLAALLPPAIARLLPLLFVLTVIGVALWYLRRRLGVMAEVFATFVRRGQWYVLPVLAGLLSIGGLLVVAASSPWLAPFIYTLF